MHPGSAGSARVQKGAHQHLPTVQQDPDPVSQHHMSTWKPSSSLLLLFVSPSSLWLSFFPSFCFSLSITSDCVSVHSRLVFVRGSHVDVMIMWTAPLMEFWTHLSSLADGEIYLCTFLVYPVLDSVSCLSCNSSSSGSVLYHLSASYLYYSYVHFYSLWVFHFFAWNDKKLYFSLILFHSDTTYKAARSHIILEPKPQRY